MTLAGFILRMATAFCAGALFVLILFAVNANAGHIPSKTGNPMLDNTVQVQNSMLTASGVVIAKHEGKGGNSCVVDLLTAAHVADIPDLFVDGEKFNPWVTNVVMDLAIMRGKMNHPCEQFAVTGIRDHISFGQSAWRTGYPFGQRDLKTGFIGECTVKFKEGEERNYPLAERMNKLDWCMHSLAGGGGASGSGVFIGPLLVGIVSKGVGNIPASPYLISLHPRHISDFVKKAYERNYNKEDIDGEAHRGR